MRDSLQILFIFTLSVFVLSGCNPSSESSNSNSETSTAVLARINLSGSDTTEIGTSVDLNYYAFREDYAGSDYFLAATSSGSALNFVRVLMGELSDSILNATAILADEADSVVFNITDIDVSIRINIDGDSYLYSVACLSGCSGVQFDVSTRTLVLDSVVVNPTIGGSDASQALSTLTLNGTITWAAADENADAPAIDSSSSGGSLGTSDVTLSDIVGVWDSGFGSDEIYTVFYANGDYTDFDYLGDAVDMGENCYDVESGEITALGNGQFQIDDGVTGTFSFSGSDLAWDVPGQPTFTLEHTTLVESDLVPLCD